MPKDKPSNKKNKGNGKQTFKSGYAGKAEKALKGRKKSIDAKLKKYGA